MNPKKLVRLSNIIGTVSIILLIYWVFTFISIEVFGLKIFRERLTETFYMSVVGILVLMAGALMLNVMFNLTRIAEKHNQDNGYDIKKARTRKLGWIFLLSFPFIFALLFLGDQLTIQKKERLLLASARSVVDGNMANTAKVGNYTFTKKWINETDDILTLLSATDKTISNVAVIVLDSIDSSRVFLSFNARSGHNGYIYSDTLDPQKKNYIFATSKPDRDYLNKTFDENNTETKFEAHDGQYELYYPYSKNGKTIVFYFTDYQRYGKLGS